MQKSLQNQTGTWVFMEFLIDEREKTRKQQKENGREWQKDRKFMGEGWARERGC